MTIQARPSRRRKNRGTVPRFSPANAPPSGDELRAAGLAVELCWLPPPQERVELGPMPGRREDGKFWFE
jgi:hypothetical protein